MNYKATYRARNDNGDGFDPARGETVEDVVAAYESEGCEVVQRAHTTDDVAVIKAPGGRWIGIGGDGMGREPWACYVD